MTRTYAKGYSLITVCNYVGISRQAYYQRIQSNNVKAKVYQEAEKVVLTNRGQKSRVGLRTIWHKEELRSLLGLNQFEQCMSSRGLALKPYRLYTKTTDSRGHHNKHENLISGKRINGENQVIIGDIAYCQNRNERYYIFHFVDYYTLELKGLIGSCNMQGINA
jgi:putative transposase